MLIKVQINGFYSSTFQDFFPSDVCLDGIDEFGCLQQVLFGAQSFSAGVAPWGQCCVQCFIESVIETARTLLFCFYLQTDCNHCWLTVYSINKGYNQLIKQQPTTFALKWHTEHSPSVQRRTKDELVTNQ